jgi:hypothetical protein
LAGAAFSSAASIRRRWSDLIDWAKAYGFESEFIAELPPPPSEDVAARIAGVSEGGGGWWNSFEMKFHEPKEKPSREDSSIALEKLLSNWLAIAGPYLGENTLPLALTGKKSRRLVVAANPSVDPPWGTWNSYAENQAAFTLFRQAVNAAIAPLEVDVVHFLTHKWVSRQQ